MNLKKLSDKDLIEKMDQLDREEKAKLTEILHHLKEIDSRRLYSAHGYKSLFDFTIQRFGYSEDQAYRRISAARLLKELPQIEQKLNNGSLSLTNLGKAQNLFQKEKKLGESMTSTEKLQVLKSLENKTTREAEKIVLSRASAPETWATERIRQVTAKLSEVKFAADDDLLKKIEKLKGLLAHSHPQISIAELFNKLCDLGIQQWDPGKKPNAMRPAAPQKQRVTKRNGRTWIPHAIQREVWRKAESKCEICKSDYALQIDHVKPVAHNGGNHSENLRLLCRACNQRAAIEKLGEMRMHKFL